MLRLYVHVSCTFFKGSNEGPCFASWLFVKTNMLDVRPSLSLVSSWQSLISPCLYQTLCPVVYFSNLEQNKHIKKNNLEKRRGHDFAIESLLYFQDGFVSSEILTYKRLNFHKLSLFDLWFLSRLLNIWNHTSRWTFNVNETPLCQTMVLTGQFSLSICRSIKISNKSVMEFRCCS